MVSLVSIFVSLTILCGRIEEPERDTGHFGGDFTIYEKKWNSAEMKYMKSLSLL